MGAVMAFVLRNANQLNGGMHILQLSETPLVRILISKKQKNH